jgi:hypothetical protein
MSHRAASFSLIVFTAMVFLSGCAKEDETASNPATTTTAGAHAHAAGDKLVWPLKETIADHEIWFGHHGNHFHGGEKIEPAISITKGGQSVDNAQVFNGLVNADNAESAGEVSTTGEVPTTYEPATNAEIAHYAQAELAIPADAKQITIRYRLKLQDQPDEFTREVTVKVGH